MEGGGGELRTGCGYVMCFGLFDGEGAKEKYLGFRCFVFCEGVCREPAGDVVFSNTKEDDGNIMD